MRRLVVLGLMSALVLSGCATPEERAMRAAEATAAAEAQKDAQCRSYGAQPGSDAYVNCRVQIDQTNAQIAAQASADNGAAMREAGRQLMEGPKTVNCTSTRMMNTVNTMCY